MFYSTKVGGGRSGGLHGYDLFAPKLPVLSSPQEFFSRSERCGEAQCVAFFRAPRLFPFSSFSHSNAVFFFYSTHYPTDSQIFFPTLIIKNKIEKSLSSFSPKSLDFILGSSHGTEETASISESQRSDIQLLAGKCKTLHDKGAAVSDILPCNTALEMTRIN